MRENKIIMRSIKEGIHVIDAEKMGIEYMKYKYPNHHKIIDFQARNLFKAGAVTISMIKCSYGYNQHATRDYKINNSLVVEECSRCSWRET